MKQGVLFYGFLLTSLALAGLAGAAVGYWYLAPREDLFAKALFGSAPADSRPSQAVTRPAYDPAAAASFDEKVGDISQQVSQAGGTRQPFRIELTEQELNAKMAESLPNVSDKIRNLRLAVGNGAITAKGEVSLGFVDVPVTLSGNVVLVQGRPQVQLRQTSVEGIPLPSTVGQQIADIINNSADLSGLSQTVDLTSITLQDGKMIVSGVSK